MKFCVGLVQTLPLLVFVFVCLYNIIYKNLLLVDDGYNSTSEAAGLLLYKQKLH